MDKYARIIDLPHHVSKVRPQMSMYQRAAQFAPFAALTGHGAAISETARLTDTQIALSESESEILNMASRAKELRSNTVIKAGEVWKISKDKTFRNDLDLQSSSQNPATIIIQGEWNPGGNIAAIQTGANVVVTSTGKIILPPGRADNKSLKLIVTFKLLIFLL